MSEFELYTDFGNALAAKLVGAVAAEVEADRLTRRQAVERLCEAVHDVRAVDSGMSDSEPFWAIARAVRGAFDKAGFERLDGDDLSLAYGQWAKGRPAADPRKHREPVDRETLVERVREAAGEVKAALDELARLPGVSVTSAKGDVYLDSDWAKLTAAAAHAVVVFTSHSASGLPGLGTRVDGSHLDCTFGAPPKWWREDGEEMADRREFQAGFPAEVREALTRLAGAEERFERAMDEFGDRALRVDLGDDPKEVALAVWCGDERLDADPGAAPGMR